MVFKQSHHTLGEMIALALIALMAMFLLLAVAGSAVLSYWLVVLHDSHPPTVVGDFLVLTLLGFGVTTTALVLCLDDI